MGLNKSQFTKLIQAVASADRKAPTAYSFEGENFSYNEMQETLRREFQEIAGTNSLYRQNKNLVFELIEEAVDDYLPKKVLEAYGQFAEVKTFGQGDRPIFTQKITQASKRRAKQFVTKVGLAGVYEVFKLDGQSFEVTTSAFGGAAQIGFEEFLDGRVDFADVLDVVMEGLDEAIYIEIEKALLASVSSLQAANKTSQSAFNEAEMDRLISVADTYGDSTIYCTFEFAATMLPVTANWSDRMKDEVWNNGRLTNYKSHNVVILPQSYTDETNSVKVIDPSHAWIIPGGANKPVKIAFEGDTIVRDFDNRDLSRELQVYKKVGVTSVITNNICVYINTSLTKEDMITA